MSSIKIMPIKHYRKVEEENVIISNDVELVPGEICFTESGKDAMRQIADYHELQREDEVYIVTSSDSPFVSSCVTSTLFNFCKVSRVLTEKTKLIFVIHEFGMPCNTIDSLALIAMDRGIPLVEDVAHSMTSRFNGRLLGSWGDYVIHSLPKSLPVAKGGILIKSSVRYTPKFNECGSSKDEFHKYRGLLAWARDKRREQYEMYRRLCSKSLVYGELGGATPFCFGYIDSPEIVKKIYEKAESEKIELLRTHNPCWVTIPLNPWFSRGDLKRIVNHIKG
ncbi:DegT/DnrJ/EryC1/StrS family aminotransferase [Aestuariirhabdus sp. Z084]|uniref:DegT/DnrJ/EryC1/StrS family aminotransferase n=1 Tax=Aestuariirhabdus haliotis TaxID=2918751 RepID=UPI0020BE2693|nr:DegT/DnrJ/EryC1/StrS family aminotransferase [Aestuariirhabdus haliotis]MCL6415801.1 DegT/DnrJ/EryC1/StrS family aminotransferase [Aestuariirhabdus haliotis]